LNRFTPFALLLILSSCNPGAIDGGSSSPNPRMPGINVEQINPDSCLEVPLPGTEVAVGIGGTLSTKECKKMCHDNYQALPETYRTDSYLSFPNYFRGGPGRCRGHAIVTQQFSMLGRFGKGANPDKCGPQNMSGTCAALYKGIIADISTGKKVRDIPGFPSLLAFSSVDPMKNILRSNVQSYSYKYSAGYGYVGPKEGNRDTNVFLEIFKRAKNNQKPYVGIKTSFGGDHAVLVTGVKYINGAQVLCVSDPNEKDYDSFQNPDCEVYIEMKNGRPHYQTSEGSSGLSKFNIMSDEDDRTVGYVDAWKDWCINEKASDGDCKKDPLIAKPE
jgi:hypothetical protein